MLWEDRFHEPGIILTVMSTKVLARSLPECIRTSQPSLVEGFGIPVLDGACLGILLWPAAANPTWKSKAFTT